MRLVASIYNEVSGAETRTVSLFPRVHGSWFKRVAAGTRARAKLCFYLLFSSVRGKVLLAMELLRVAMYVLLGPLHQRRCGCYAPIYAIKFDALRDAVGTVEKNSIFQLL